MSFYIGLSLLSNNISQDDRHKEGRRILSLLDTEIFGTEKSLNQTIEVSTSGKPYFKDHHAKFSISHSVSMTAVSFLADSETEIGCDVQYMNPKKKFDNISKEFYHPEEHAFINEANTDDEKLRRFYSIWVLNESFLKMMGWSVFDILKTPSFIKNENDFSSNEYYCYVKEYGDEKSGRYMTGAILSSSEKFLPVITWFSENTLAENYLPFVMNIDATKVVASPMKTVKPNK
jgi:phosphopantetheinyl transferase